MATHGLQTVLRGERIQEAFNEAHYRHFFSRLTGNSPYPYQLEVAKSIAEGKSLILRAPTGSGKTWAAVAPFLYSVAAQKKLADRLIYTLPLRSLASNLHDNTLDKLRTVSEFQGHVCNSAKNRRYHANDPFYLGLQMGGQQDDPFFEGDIIFTTIDQLLSSYLFAPVSLPDRIGNIGAGALVGSLLVFDEIHLLDAQRSLATTIEMLDRLKGLAQSVLMTATMPDSVMQWVGKRLDASLMSLSAEEVKQLPSHTNKKREFEWRSSPLSSADIINEHKNRTIVIVNTVGRAQELFRQVWKGVGGDAGAPQVFLLHSRFFPQDRKHWEAGLTRYFGPNATQGNAILISTQVVEAGIDISADVLLTELAPLNSLLQRAGRVARYRQRNTGAFLVFELTSDSQNRPRLGPYIDVPELIVATRGLLVSKDKLQSLDYTEELLWLETIHGGPDLQALQPLNSLHNHRQQVLAAMDGLNEAACSQLVRETSSVNIVLTNNPEALRFTATEWPELLSVPRTSIFRLTKACQNADTSDWVLKVPDEIQTESNQGLNFQWRPTRNPATIAWLAAINPAYASYSKEIGLELNKPSDAMPGVCYRLSPPVLRYSYRKEPFVIHAKRVADRAARIIEHCPHGLRYLDRRYQGVGIREIFMLACALHDTGKLQTAWQNQAHQWQRHIDQKLGRGHITESLAHTDFDPERDRGEQWYKFPPHAACGGFALLPYFAHHFPDGVPLLLCTAITRHHGTHTKELKHFELVNEAEVILEQSLPESAPRPIIINRKSSPGDLACFSEDYLLHFKEVEGWWALYASVVRLLRLADQGSFQD